MVLAVLLSSTKLSIIKANGYVANGIVFKTQTSSYFVQVSKHKIDFDIYIMVVIPLLKLHTEDHLEYKIYRVQNL